MLGLGSLICSKWWWYRRRKAMTVQEAMFFGHHGCLCLIVYCKYFRSSQMEDWCEYDFLHTIRLKIDVNLTSCMRSLSQMQHWCESDLLHAIIRARSKIDMNLTSYIQSTYTCLFFDFDPKAVFSEDVVYTVLSLYFETHIGCTV